MRNIIRKWLAGDTIVIDIAFFCVINVVQGTYIWVVLEQRNLSFTFSKYKKKQERQSKDMRMNILLIKFIWGQLFSYGSTIFYIAFLLENYLTRGGITVNNIL